MIALFIMAILSTVAINLVVRNTKKKIEDEKSAGCKCSPDCKCGVDCKCKIDDSSN